ncbi:hypothetical protein V5799_006410 [Amblyomma americanum]|uniref:Secreted protein n=1 Tax=Amblyomma americanum TaxID=6943 RepID=A0AAQ4DWG9_AMBAM
MANKLFSSLWLSWHLQCAEEDSLLWIACKGFLHILTSFFTQPMSFLPHRFTKARWPDLFTLQKRKCIWHTGTSCVVGEKQQKTYILINTHHFAHFGTPTGLHHRHTVHLALAPDFGASRRRCVPGSRRLPGRSAKGSQTAIFLDTSSVAVGSVIQNGSALDARSRCQRRQEKLDELRNLLLTGGNLGDIAHSSEDVLQIGFVNPTQYFFEFYLSPK